MSLESRAETAKLARVLGTDADLAFLEKADPAELRALRERATEVLFEADRGPLQRAVAASRILPTQLLAAIGRHAFGPLLCARMSGMLDPDRAVGIAVHFPIDFLAEVAAEMDPRRATDVVARMPKDRIVAIAAEMAGGREFVAMGRFVGHLDDDTLRATIAELDDEALLRIGFVLEEPDRVDHVVAMLDDARLEDFLRAARDLEPEAEFIASHLGARNRKRLVRVAERMGDPELVERIKAAGR